MSRHAFVDVPEGQIHYQSAGAGEPILLLHQTFLSSEEYSEVIPLLAKQFCVLAPDTLGYGYSSKPLKRFNIPDYARSMLHFLDALNIERASVVGHHTGACITVELAGEYPERIGKIVLSGCPCFRQPEDGTKWMSNSSYQPILPTTDGSHLLKVWDMALDRYTDKRLDLAMKYVLEYFMAGERVEEGHWAAFLYDTRSRLPCIKSPTLLLCGDRDFFYGDVDTIKALVPDSRVSIIEGGANHTPRLRASEWAANVIAFLNDS